MRTVTENSPNHSDCEALGCNSAATTGLELKAGKGRSILLHLCNDCTQRFKEIIKTLDQCLPAVTRVANPRITREGVESE